MVGNVSECVPDDASSSGSQRPARDCLNCKVYRGGNFKVSISDSRVSKREETSSDTPSQQSDQLYPNVGFRCAKNAPANMNLVPKKTNFYLFIIKAQ